MNAKHSPGNWCAEFVGVAGPQDNPSHDVFEITNGHDRIAENVHERDAALLVAAPRLLDALRALVDAANSVDGGDDVVLPPGCALFDDARAAIALVDRGRS